jgi:Outer membrane protein beta-barrel domain
MAGETAQTETRPPRQGLPYSSVNHPGAPLKRSFTPLLILVLTGFLAPRASAQFGVAAGLNFESISDIDTESFTGNFDTASGYHVGIFLDMGAGPIALRLGAFYRELGDFDVAVEAVRETINISAIDFPVDLRFNILPTPVVTPYITAGPVFSLPRSDDQNFNASLNALAVAGNVGFGLELRVGGMTLFPEFRYSIGVSSFVKDQFSLGGKIFVAEQNDQRSNTAMLRLGIGF